MLLGDIGTMRSLVVYYSCSGNTGRIGKEIAKRMGADIEEIHDSQNYGPMFKGGSKSKPASRLTASLGAILHFNTRLEPMVKDPSKYDLVVIGTPLWAGRMPPATRTFVKENKGRLKEVALFCTSRETDPVRMFAEIEDILGKESLSVLWLDREELEKGGFDGKVAGFVGELSR